MRKLDYVKQQKQLYKDSQGTATIIDVPLMNYIVYNGRGYPEDNPDFKSGINSLFNVAYAIKYLPKRGLEPADYQDFKMPPLEAIWCMNNNLPFDKNMPAEWRWTLMLRMPDFVSQELVNKITDILVLTKKDPDVCNVKAARIEEGRAVQIVHKGPYCSEAEDIKKLQHLATSHDYELIGHHHEIYFNDPRRVSPERLRTLIRHPITKRPAADSVVRDRAKQACCPAV